MAFHLGDDLMIGSHNISHLWKSARGYRSVATIEPSKNSRISRHLLRKVTQLPSNSTQSRAGWDGWRCFQPSLLIRNPVGVLIAILQTEGECQMIFDPTLRKHPHSLGGITQMSSRYAARSGW